MTPPFSRIKPAAGWAAATLFAFALSGYAVGPNFREPAAPAVDQYTRAALPASTVSAATPGGDAQRFLEGRDVPQRWWTTFGNDELDRRVETALAHSPTIASAQAALRQAEENAKAAGGSLFPSLDASAGATRANQITGAGAGAGGAVRGPVGAECPQDAVVRPHVDEVRGRDGG